MIIMARILHLFGEPTQHSPHMDESQTNLINYIGNAFYPPADTYGILMGTWLTNGDDEYMEPIIRIQDQTQGRMSEKPLVSEILARLELLLQKISFLSSQHWDWQQTKKQLETFKKVQLRNLERRNDIHEKGGLCQLNSLEEVFMCSLKRLQLSSCLIEFERLDKCFGIYNSNDWKCFPQQTIKIISLLVICKSFARNVNGKVELPNLIVFFLQFCGFYS